MDTGEVPDRTSHAEAEPLTFHEGTGSARKEKTKQLMGRWAALAQKPWQHLRCCGKQGAGSRAGCLQGTSCQVWEKTGIQMVILIFHLANWSPHLLSGTTVICS